MRLQDIREAYYDYSSKLGNRAVALSLSGLGIVWLFKTDTASGPLLTGELLAPSVFFVLSVALDLFQTAYCVFAFGLLARKRERDAPPQDLDSRTPRWLHLPTVFMFYGKFAAVVIGYVLLVSFVLGRFHPV